MFLENKGVLQGCHFSWKNLEFDNLGKKKPGKTWNFKQFLHTKYYSFNLTRLIYHVDTKYLSS